MNNNLINADCYWIRAKIELIASHSSINNKTLCSFGGMLLCQPIPLARYKTALSVCTDLGLNSACIDLLQWRRSRTGGGVVLPISLLATALIRRCFVVQQLRTSCRTSPLKIQMPETNSQHFNISIKCMLYLTWCTTCPANPQQIEIVKFET